MNALLALIRTHFVIYRYEKSLPEESRRYARSLRYWLASVHTDDDRIAILDKEIGRLQGEQERLTGAWSTQDLSVVNDKLKVVQHALAKVTAP